LIWLEDGSPIGIYRSDGRKLTASRALKRRFIREGFERFVWPEVAADHPEQVWFIGHDVGRALKRNPSYDESRLLWAPMGAVWYRATQEDNDQVDELCRQLAVVAPKLPGTSD
jgi:hypothetical protein